MSRRRGGLYEIIGALEHRTGGTEPAGDPASPSEEACALRSSGNGHGRPTTQPAVFLDRDGTIIADVGFIDDPARVELLPGAAEAVRRLNHAGILVVVATNQSGVARGLFGEDVVRATNQRIQHLLAEQEAQIDAFYHCPYLDGPEAVVEAYRRSSDWRKPEPGMLLAAAEDLGIDLGASWMIGDAARDVEAGRRAGCRSILVGRNGRARATRTADCPFAVRTLSEAVDIVEREMSQHTNPTPTPVVRVVRKSQAESAADADAGIEPSAGAATPGRVAAGAEQQAHRAGEVSTARRGSDADGAPGADQADAIEARLIEIRDLLETDARRERQTDFSLLRLVSSLLQMLAAVAAVWGAAALLTQSAADAVPRLLLACFLQIAAVTAMLSDRFR